MESDWNNVSDTRHAAQHIIGQMSTDDSELWICHCSICNGKPVNRNQYYYHKVSQQALLHHTSLMDKQKLEENAVKPAPPTSDTFDPVIAPTENNSSKGHTRSGTDSGPDGAPPNK